MEKKQEKKSKTEMVGDRNTRKAKTTSLVNTECLTIKMCFNWCYSRHPAYKTAKKR